MSYNLLTILGPTASGKTSFATQLAYQLNAEIISGDSRQIYKSMDIGTGKDLNEYTVNNTLIPYHLIDIESPGIHYNIFRFQNDFVKVYQKLQSQQKLPIFCGGSGLYMETILREYKLHDVPKNTELRDKLSNLSLQELIPILKNYKTLHNTTDIDTAKRAIRAIEIADFYKNNPQKQTSCPTINSLNICFFLERNIRRKLITERLKLRLEHGLVTEIQNLLNTGLTPDQLIYYGLEYKYVTLYVVNQLSYEEMFNKLETAIHQFAKRQMTWFRGMERRGLKLHWLDASLSLEEKKDFVLKLLNE